MRKVCVLVVDDDPDICDFVQTLLTDEGYEVVVAPHGAAALNLLARYRPDIILLDMRMPVMDGRAFVHAYAQLPGPHARIIMVTATSDIRTVASLSGVDAVIEKPFRVNHLLDLIAYYSSTQGGASGAPGAGGYAYGV